jgi:Uma2 family endonuclease
MSDAALDAYAPTPPPGEDELPCDDGEPMETERHRKQMNVLIDSLDDAWRDRDDVYVGGNMAVYFSELQAKKNDFRGPDVFVVLDTVRRERKSWVVWGENGRTPDVVIELLSPSTEAVDRGEKMRVYSKLLRVTHYYLFDPMSGELQGYTLDPVAREYVPTPPDRSGDVPCPALGLHLGIRRGPLLGVEADWLRWVDKAGHVLPVAEERANTLAEQLAEYQKRFGPLSPEKAT